LLDRKTAPVIVTSKVVIEETVKIKKRLDQAVQELYPALSKTQIQSYIMQGKVMVDNRLITKPGTAVGQDEHIVLAYQEPKYVCRAGWKLEKALDAFHIDPTGLVVLDAGLSTGGFTDCLLQRGAAKVYGVDVGYGQAHEKIRQDPRVVVMEKTNLRHLEKLPELVDLVTLDLSFISLIKVIPAVKNLLKPQGQLITLIKPQFEAGRHEVGKGGIVRDPAVHKAVVEKVTHEIEDAGFMCHGVIESPIEGTDGNKEFLAHFTQD
jgi:23S rRNA (cytidine1920-2'-O)/16S rRNA (cytidine1409-2'-O)-methyltransferase